MDTGSRQENASNKILTCRVCLTQRLDCFINALKDVVRAQHFKDAETPHGVEGAEGLEPGDGKVNAVGMAVANEIGHNLCRGKIDLDNAGGFEHEQPRFPGRGLQGRGNDRR